MLIRKLLDLLNNEFPPETALEGDKTGLQLQSGLDNISRIYVTLEITDNSLNEAIESGCDCVISFHPLIYNPLSDITENDRTGRLCTKLIKNNIALISVHTNFDVHPKGTSRILAEKLNLITQDFLVKSSAKEGFGMGVIAKPLETLDYLTLIDRVSQVCGSPVRFNKGNNSLIKRIAIVGGSGTSFIQDALDAEVDAFITSDVSYHRFHQTDGRLILIDPGHYEMEQFVPEGLAGILKNLIPKNENVTVTLGKAVTNPVCYFPNEGKYIEIQKENIFYNINTW
jgi:dinuclear metal center YbgI/SA1388 family protein